MTNRMTRHLAGAALIALVGATAPASAQTFDWQKNKGTTLNLLFNNHPWSQAMREMAKDFTAKTGIDLRIDIFNEEQFRTRLTTVMQAKSADIDAYMTLTVREGAVFDKAGWYADLKPMIENKALTSGDFNYEDFGSSLRTANTLGGKVVAIPINLEGPLFYWRKDIFAKCNVPEPMTVEDITEAAKKLKACDANQGVWAARGLRGAVPYALTGFINNLGGSYVKPDGSPGLCQDKTLTGIEAYSNLLKDYGPPGATNHTFTQVIELLGQGRIAMTYESSNEFANIMKFPGRDKDLGVKTLPKGKDTGIQKPVAIGWGVTISSNSSKKDAAWTFIQWATSREMQTVLANRGVAPPRASVFDGAEFKAWQAELPIRQSWVNALVETGRTGTGIYQTNTDRIPEARELIGRAVQEIVLGQKSAKDAACAADADLAKLQ
jgi:multiple sugar transport system substrate-binding protein